MGWVAEGDESECECVVVFRGADGSTLDAKHHPASPVGFCPCLSPAPTFLLSLPPCLPLRIHPPLQTSLYQSLDTPFPASRRASPLTLLGPSLLHFRREERLWDA
jgi:hypothetical protein